MASAGRANQNKQPTPLSRESISKNAYGKNRDKQETTAQNPALSKDNAKSVVKLGTQYKLGK